jgi:OmpA-OmpF porin, OOP family
MKIIRVSSDCQHFRSAYHPAVANRYASSAARDRGAYRLPGPDRLGGWAALAMLGSVLLHVVVFFALDRMKIVLRFEQAKELSTRPSDVQQVQIQPLDEEKPLPPENVVKPTQNTAALLEEVDLLDKLPKEQEIDIKPEIVQAEYALQESNPAREGTPEASASEISSGFEIEANLPQLGREPENIKPAEVGQLTVDPGAVQADDSEMGKFAEDLIRKGANGKVENGTLDGVVSLDSMLNLPPNVLVGKKTLLPSDLLFDFNKSDLRESAKVGLMKLCLLIDQNPGLYCWIEGYTDLVGGDEFNLNLSIKRAEAVRNYLVHSLKVEGSRIISRGFGRDAPIVTAGTAAEQSANRRVEIRMRKTLPPKQQTVQPPQKAVALEEPPAPKAVLVKPLRQPPVGDILTEPDQEPEPPRAASIEETPPTEEAPPLRALPAFEEVPRAAPVEGEPEPEPEPPRAQTVEDE